jgi:hypothetical protein
MTGDSHLKVAASKTENTIARVNEVLDAFTERDYNGEVLTAVAVPGLAAEFANWLEWVRPGCVQHQSVRIARRIRIRNRRRRRHTPGRMLRL